jgi:hypothetical protein
MYGSFSPRQLKGMLTRFFLNLGLVILIVNSIVVSLLSYFPSEYYSITLIALNFSACVASSLGVITVWRYGFRGIHGRSLLFLTLGIIAWFVADLTLVYGHFILHKEEEQSLVVSFSDLYWVIGYVFFALHLFTALRLIHRTQIHTLSVILVIVVSASVIAYDIILSSEFLIGGQDRIIGETRTGLVDLALSILYPALDLALVVPSIIILTANRKDCYNFIPWILSSLSLLTNAVADNGFVHQFLQGNTKDMWIWDLFFVTDYIILSGAFYWYNKFHNAMEIE